MSPDLNRVVIAQLGQASATIKRIRENPSVDREVGDALVALHTAVNALSQIVGVAVED